MKNRVLNSIETPEGGAVLIYLFAQMEALDSKCIAAMLKP